MLLGFGGRWLERIAALIVVWLIGEGLNARLQSENIWVPLSFLAIALVLEFLAFREGVVAGIRLYKESPAQQKKEIDRILEAGDSNDS